MDKDIIAWWSGGAASAVTCKLCIDLFGKDRTRIVFIDTRNEDDDTYRFLKDCERWYGIKIETIYSSKYENIKDVWMDYLSLNVATGAICSTWLKRRVREEWQKNNPFSFQAFGFDLDEPKRALGMSMNNPNVKPVYPLLLHGYRKDDCFKILKDAKIELPIAYKMGFHNNNCLKTGCVQGGIGYWQKMRDEYPDIFDAMANEEHLLTNLKGKPVTMLKDQSKEAKDSGNTLVFLKPHPDYPKIKDISMMKGHPVQPLVECNGYCGINDLSVRNPTEQELNFELEQ